MRRLCSVIGLSSALALSILAHPVAAIAQIICVSNNIPPPEFPVYAQPPIPASGYIWTPGYWAGGPNGYFWVPGTWVMPPTVGMLWTPGYWGWRDGIYVWTAGYWGPHIGFYGGVNYGFGYTGLGYEGGHWDNGVFAYNRTVNNFGGITITNVYEKTVIVDETTRVSFNGGSGGITAQPTPEQEAAAHEQHVAAIPAQLQHERVASTNKALLASENHGHPAIAATATPGDFTKGVVAAREATPAPGVTPEAKPAGAAAVGPNPTGNKSLENKKPLNPEAKPLNGEEKRVNTETKPLNPESKQLNTQSKSSNGEAKLPPAQERPQPPPPPKPSTPQLQPHTAGAAPHPGPAAPHPTSSSKDKKQPPG